MIRLFLCETDGSEGVALDDTNYESDQVGAAAAVRGGGAAMPQRPLTGAEVAEVRAQRTYRQRHQLVTLSPSATRGSRTAHMQRQ